MTAVTSKGFVHLVKEKLLKKEKTVLKIKEVVMGFDSGYMKL